jgi:hypothetical protein
MFRTCFRGGVCVAALLLGFGGLFLKAQIPVGRISGTVADPTGAAVAGAPVTITNTDTQAQRTVSTDGRGFYSMGGLPIGPYKVEVDQTGFKQSGQTGLTLVADGRITANFTLQVGELSQTVAVEAQSEQLNTVSGEIAHVIDQRQVNNLPLNGRSYMELLTLVPGATVTNPDQFSVNTSLSATNQVVNGHRSNQNNITVDGVGNLDNGSNGSLINNISPDFMQEVKIQTSNFSAEYGRSTGAAFNLATKNGTNAFHGALFEYFRNDALDARNFFSPEKTQLRFNDFGYNLGGPIVKNKLFFFVGEEWKRLRQQAAPSRQTLPSLAELQGNFAGTGQTINMPGTTAPYPNNVIPASQITPDGKAIANVYKTVIPLAATYTNTAKSNNTIFQTPNPLDYREDLARVDYRINDKHTLYGRWVADDNSIYLAFGPGSNLPITPEIRSRPGRSALLDESWIISPYIVNEAHIGASWNGQRYLNQGDTWQRATQGFTFQRVFNTAGPYANGIPNASITSFASWYGPSKTLYSPTTEIEAGDTLSIVAGQHTIRTGFLLIRNRKNQNGRSDYNGNISFNATGNPNTTGYALADALLGNFNSYTEAAYDPMGYYRYTQPAAFVDDAWKVSRKLSLNFGLRYEYFMTMYSQLDNLTNFVPSLYNPANAVEINSSGRIVAGSGDIYNGLQRVANGIPSQYNYLVPNASDPAVLAVPDGGPRGMYPNHHTFSPRVGFAYALNDKTVFRGGFGIFYDRIQGNPTFYTLNNPPYVSSTSYNYGNLSNIAGGKTSPPAPFGTLQTVQPNLKVPYSEQFSFSVQHDLPFHLFAEADYVGTLGRHLLVEPDMNQPTFAVLGAASSKANINTLRPYTGYSVIQQFMSAATSNYHALQLQLSRRMGNVTFTAAYTFSKALGNASSDTQNDKNYYDLYTMYGPLSFDASHVFTGSFVYSLPKLQSRPLLLRAPLGNWQISGIIHLQSGFPDNIVGNTTVLTGSREADYVGGPAILSNKGADGWYNPAAFTPAPQGRFGNSGYGNLRQPGLQQYNLSAARFFNITERMNLQFRADFINAFNHTNFMGPDNNVSNATFGTISGAYPSRDIQLSMKLQF